MERGGGVNYFSGVFDGNGHTISNFTYSSTGTNYIGLFGGVAGPALSTPITNLTLIDPDVNAGTGTHAGALVAYLESGIITDCHVRGGSVRGNGAVGGLAGTQSWNSYGGISNCDATTYVRGIGYKNGGLVGNNYGAISNCYSGSNVKSWYGWAYAGGLVGWNGAGVISDCYATGNVSGVTDLGGLVGGNQGTISNCYSTGSVSGTIDIGGLVGWNNGSVTDSFWDTDTSAQPSSAGGTGKTTTQMQTESTFTDAGWDFVGEDGDGAEWMMLREGEDYPRLGWQAVFAGDIAGLYGVDVVDLAELASHWGAAGCSVGCEDADINEDGYVDWGDFGVMSEHWLSW